MGESGAISDNCICLISRKPNPTWLDFLGKFKAHDVFVVVDDNDIDYAQVYRDKYPSTNFVQLDNSECERLGFANMNYLIKKRVTGWEKAVYYFSKLNRNYQNTWFLEDDVFIYDEETLQRIDAQYEGYGILAQSCTERQQSRSWNHWTNTQINFVPLYESTAPGNRTRRVLRYLSRLSAYVQSPPHFKSMVCAIRISNTLLGHIADYADKNKTLFFLEALFPTVAMQYSLPYGTPRELQTILFRHDWTGQNVNKTQLFHPVKDVELHQVFRKVIA